MDRNTFALICALILCGASYSHAVSTWSYSGDNGPEHWGTLQPGSEACGVGLSQTPIDLVTADQVAVEYPPFELVGYDNTESFDGPRIFEMINNGHTAQLNMQGEILLSGGGLPSTFNAIQAHLHWGSDSTQGSEHIRNGVAYAAELHAVHLDFINYGREALTTPEGVAVLGFFIEEGEHNSAWDPIFESISEIKYPDSSYDFTTVFGLESIIPPRAKLNRFSRYNGSLTTPGCYETVVWSVFEETIKLSAEQLELLRTLSYITEDEEMTETRVDPLVDNFRPIQPVNNRTVYAGVVTENDSCSDRCNQIDVDAEYPCQCNAACQNNGDCCEDYGDNCLVEVCSYVHTYQNKSRKQRRMETAVDDDTATR